MMLTDAQIALIVIAQQGVHALATALPHVRAAAVMEDKELLALFPDDLNAGLRAIVRFKRELRCELRSRERQAVENEERFGPLSGVPLGSPAGN